MQPKFAIIDDVFEENAFRFLDDYSKKVFAVENQQFSTNQEWHQDIKCDRGVVLKYGLLAERDDDAIKTLIESMIPYCEQENVVISHAYLYYWLTDSYIPWHNDHGHDASMTVYLNDNWSKNNGGYWMTSNDDGTYLAVCPKRNMGIYQKGGVQHSTTPVTTKEIRRTIQIWLKERT